MAPLIRLYNTESRRVEEVTDAWIRWNNATSGVMLPTPDVVLGNQAESGVDNF